MPPHYMRHVDFRVTVDMRYVLEEVHPEQNSDDTMHVDAELGVESTGRRALDYSAGHGDLTEDECPDEWQFQCV